MIFDIVRSISKIPNSIKRSVFIKEASNSLNINEESLITEMNKLIINDQKEFKPISSLIKEKPKDKKPVEEINNAINFHEKECVRMLVNYGTTDFEVIGLNRKSFIEYFLNEIEDVEFRNKNYIKIIDIFKKEFQKNNINIVGVSKDSVKAQSNFSTKNDFILFSKFLSTASGLIIDNVCSILLIIIFYKFI